MNTKLKNIMARNRLEVIRDCLTTFIGPGGDPAGGVTWPLHQIHAMVADFESPFTFADSDTFADSNEQDNEMDTLGSLVDKLTIVNLKMWHNQEVLYEIRRMTQTEFAARWGADLVGLRDVLARCCDLNVQRSKLMDEIDVYLQDVVTGKRKPEDLVRGQHKTY